MGKAIDMGPSARLRERHVELEFELWLYELKKRAGETNEKI